MTVKIINLELIHSIAITGLGYVKSKQYLEKYTCIRVRRISFFPWRSKQYFIIGRVVKGGFNLWLSLYSGSCKNKEHYPIFKLKACGIYSKIYTKKFGCVKIDISPYMIVQNVFLDRNKL